MITKVLSFALEWPVSMTTFLNKTKVFLGVDIGGTKIRWALCGEGRVLYGDTSVTHKGKEALWGSIQALFIEAGRVVKARGWEFFPQVGIATPGKLIGPSRHIISRGSARNLESFETEFDNLDMAVFLGPIFPKKWVVKIENDAIAQMKGGLTQLKEGAVPGKWGYVGPGTGLGGGFATVQAHGDIEVYTDGHIYDIALQNSQGRWQSAEDLISGRAFFEKTGVLAQDAPLDHPYILEMAGYLEQLLEKLFEGHIQKISADNNWSEPECARVKGTTHFLMGGSLGSNTPFSAMFLKKIETRFRLFSVPNRETAPFLGMYNVDAYPSSSYA